MDIRRALIVDDSKLVCFKLGKMLEEKGISSHAVGSGEEALVYLGTNPSPDVAFIDIMMPGMDGYQTIEAIRAQPAFAHLPVIMCSSNDTDEDRAQALRRGANGFLPKPPSSERLSRLLSNLSTALAPAPATPPAPTPPTPALTPTPPPAAGEHITAEVAGRLVREAVEAAERAVRTRMEDLTHRLALEVEETARRVAGTVATEAARTVAQRTAAETAAQNVGENARQMATQAAGEVVRNLVPELIPGLVQERMRMIAATMMPALAEQAIQEAGERVGPELLRQLAAPTAEATLRTALPEVVPGVISEVTARLRENLRTDLAREIPDKVGHAAAALLESDSFRLSMTKTVRHVAESIADQTARSVAEATAHAAVEKNLTQTATVKSSPGEQLAQEALRQIEELTQQLRTTKLALGAGLVVVILYLVTRLFI
ncbi:conserved hypothetical protein [Gammaproteobacteria bacterium]